MYLFTNPVYMYMLCKVLEPSMDPLQPHVEGATPLVRCYTADIVQVTSRDAVRKTLNRGAGFSFTPSILPSKAH